MFRILTAILLNAMLVPISGPAQRRPDFSGDWMLASATGTATRGAPHSQTSKSGDERPTKSNTVSGAAFNCGRECTILQKSQMLTIRNALLASDTIPAPTVTLQLNGSPVSVVDSFNPPREIQATATWNDGKLEITSSTGSSTVTQVLSLEAGQLVAITSSSRDAASRVTFKYKKREIRSFAPGASQ